MFLAWTRKLLPNMRGSLLISVEVGIKEIRKEKEFHYDEKEKQLYEDYTPKGFPDSHSPESLIIEEPYFFKCVCQRGIFFIDNKQ